MGKMSAILKKVAIDMKWCVKRLEDLFTVDCVVVKVKKLFENLTIFSIILHKPYINLMDVVLMTMVIDLS